MGWLGWSYEQTLDTPIPVIELAMRGLFEKLKAIHRSAETTAPSPEEVVAPAPDLIRAAFRAATANRDKPASAP